MGAWKSFDEMEENITLVELDAMVKAIRKDQTDTRVFQAALKGIDLNKYDDNSVETKRKEIERRAQERIHGFAAAERAEFAGFGFGFVEDIEE